jgi:hypothetical protein
MVTLRRGRGGDARVTRQPTARGIRGGNATGASAAGSAKVTSLSSFDAMTAPVQPAQSFPDVGTMLEKFADALEVIIGGFGHPWAESSQAAAENALEDTLAGRWAQRPVLLATSLVAALLNHTEDHLRGMALLAGQERILMVPFTLARPVLGSAARANFLLERNISARERVRRAMSIKLKMISELDRIGLASSTTEIANIVEGAKQAGFHVTLPGRRRGGEDQPPQIGPPLPREMSLARAVLDDVPGDETGDIVYRVASAFVHGEPHFTSLMSVRDHSPNPAPESTTVQLGMRLDNFVVFTASAIFAVHRTAMAALAYAGLPDSVWLDVIGPTLLRWQASLHAVRETAFRDMREGPPGG